MSNAPTDSGRVVAFLVLALLGAGPAGAPPPAMGADSTGDRPVLFRNPDKETANRILNFVNLFGNPSPSDRERARDGLAEIGYWAVPRLLDEARSRKAQARTNALLVLGRLHDPRAIAPYRRVVTPPNDPHDWPPVIAALNLGRELDAEDATFEAFEAALRSRENELRQVAVLLALAKLGRVEEKRAGGLVEQTLDRESPNPAVHWAAFLSLGFFPSRVARPTADGLGWEPTDRVRLGLKDSTWQVRLSAILALAVSRVDAFQDIFVEALRTDGDRLVRQAALLALGKDPSAETTEIVAGVLDSVKSNALERRTAAYLLSVRGDPRSLDSLRRAASSSSSPDVAAAAVVALGGLEDPRAVAVVKQKLADRSATVRAAAAVSCTRFRAVPDLEEARDLLRARLRLGEHDASARYDMELAIAEIGRILADREVEARGGKPEPRPPVEWRESDAADLFRGLGRTHRQAVLDLVNLRVLQVFGIDALPDYRPHYDPSSGIPPTDGLPGDGAGGRGTKQIQKYTDQYDLLIELTKRPYFVDEDLPGRTVEALPK